MKFFLTNQESAQKRFWKLQYVVTVSYTILSILKCWDSVSPDLEVTFLFTTDIIKRKN